MDYTWSILQESPLQLTKNIQSISYLKANAAELVNQLEESGEPLVVTQHGKARMVVMDAGSYDRLQEALALSKLLSMGRREAEAGKSRPAAAVFAKLEKRLAGSKPKAEKA
jgi:prevent-host-death family protein